MRNRYVLRSVIAGAALVVAAVGYVLFIPFQVLHPNLLSRLVIGQTNLPGISATPTFSAPLPTASSSLQTLASAGNSTPSGTGSYASDWYGSVSSGSNVSIEIDILPTVAVAKTALQEATTQDLGAAALRAAKHAVKTHFSIANGIGATYLTPRVKPKQGKAGPPVPGATIDARVGRAIMRETVGGVVATQSHALSVASAQTDLLKKVEPTFPSLQTTHVPLVASIVYIVISLLVAIGLSLIPDWLRFASARRRAQHEARMKRQYQVRGSKALKRHRVRI